MGSLPGNPFHQFINGSEEDEFTYVPDENSQPYYVCIGVKSTNPKQEFGAYVLSVVVWANGTLGALGIVGQACDHMLKAAEKFRESGEDRVFRAEEKIDRWYGLREAAYLGECGRYAVACCHPVNKGQPLSVGWASNC